MNFTLKTTEGYEATLYVKVQPLNKQTFLTNENFKSNFWSF